MAAGDKTLGKRLPDMPGGDDEWFDGWDMPAGSYWRILESIPGHQPGPENLTGTIWGISVPRLGGIAVLSLHTVRENDDGSISVVPGDGSSNSILISTARDTWHGYIYDGVWEEV